MQFLIRLAYKASLIDDRFCTFNTFATHKFIGSVYQFFQSCCHIVFQIGYLTECKVAYDISNMGLWIGKHSKITPLIKLIFESTMNI